MYKNKIEKLLVKTAKDLGFIPPTDALLYIPEKQGFGDYASNMALQLSKQKHKNAYQNPIAIANAIIEHIGHPDFLERIETAGPGFINFHLKDEKLAGTVLGEDDSDALGDLTEAKRIIVEYCDPNTHKMLHIGHLLQLTLGETLARLLEYQGHEVFRANYGSDIGLTVAKCMWGIGKLEDEFTKTRAGSLREKAQFLGKAYAYAHAEYEKSLEVKEEIDQITNKMYQRDPEITPLWEETKEWSLGYFETIYSIFGTLFDRRINESEVDKLGKQIVLENIGKVFELDQGAVIFPGERYNLHNRVFINGKGNPTYEGKEVGLAEKYQEIFSFDQLNIFSHKEQDDYFKVVIAVNEKIHPHLKGKIKHVSYGEVKLPSGKMSSRTGNVVGAEEILDEVVIKIKEISPELDSLSAQKLAVAAIKFAFLKYSVSSDIIYDLNESISIHGDTGPYVLYVYARIKSLLRKAAGINRANEDEAEEEDDEAQDSKIAQKKFKYPGELAKEERDVLRNLEYFEFMTAKAADNFQPNELVKYLLNLCKSFNIFYEKQSVIGSKNQEFRLSLASKTAETIKLGLYLLGIETVDKM